MTNITVADQSDTVEMHGIKYKISRDSRFSLREFPISKDSLHHLYCIGQSETHM